MIYFCLHRNSQYSVASPYHVLLEQHTFSEQYVHRDHSRGVCYQILVVLCEPVNVETESRNFSDLGAQSVYRWQ